MSKKRRITSKNEKLAKKSKSDEDDSDSSSMAPVDFSSPRKMFETLISPITFEDFTANYWESKPLVIHRPESSVGKLYGRLFTKQDLFSLVRKEELQFVTDINVVQYKNGQRENGNGKGRATASKLDKLFNGGGTFQIHQPQRFQLELRRVLENMESFFGCLVGANVYMTPSGCQGLPPHYDDVEVFILQTEGEKHWRLYKPLVELPQEYSKDLLPEQIGNPTHDFVLKAGDLLYFPRGTIHQAVASSSQTHSTHITISTYQHHSWGDYLNSIFPELLQEAMDSDVSFRRGLPINFLKSSKISKSGKMNSVVQLLLQKIKYTQFVPPESMIEDFMFSRLPPYGVDGEELRDSIPDGVEPSLKSLVKLSHPDHICFLIKAEPPTPAMDDEDESDDESDEDDEEPVPSKKQAVEAETADRREMLYVYSSIYNDHRAHMMNKQDREDDSSQGLVLKFPKHYLDAVDQLKSSSDQFILVQDFDLRSNSDKENLARALWSSHLLEVHPNRNSKALKATKVD